MSQPITDQIKKQLDKLGKSRAWLAHGAQISQSSLDKALAGHRPLPTAALYKVEQFLGVDLSKDTHQTTVADDRLGAYSDSASEWLTGQYIAVRAARKTEGAFVVSAAKIEWEHDNACLLCLFSAAPEGGIDKVAKVAIGARSGHIHLLTERMGDLELVSLRRPSPRGTLIGVQLASERDPFSRPIVLCPESLPNDWRGTDYGLIKPQHRHYKFCQTLFQEED